MDTKELVHELEPEVLLAIKVLLASLAPNAARIINPLLDAVAPAVEKAVTGA